eukprot:scaffold20244_cov109-Isochrysis_galbana.AAC.2
MGDRFLRKPVSTSNRMPMAWHTASASSTKRRRSATGPAAEVRSRAPGSRRAASATSPCSPAPLHSCTPRARQSRHPPARACAAQTRLARAASRQPAPTELHATLLQNPPADHRPPRTPTATAECDAPSEEGSRSSPPIHMKKNKIGTCIHTTADSDIHTFAHLEQPRARQLCAVVPVASWRMHVLVLLLVAQQSHRVASAAALRSTTQEGEIVHGRALRDTRVIPCDKHRTRHCCGDGLCDGPETVRAAEGRRDQVLLPGADQPPHASTRTWRLPTGCMHAPPLLLRSPAASPTARA